MDGGGRVNGKADFTRESRENLLMAQLRWFYSIWIWSGGFRVWQRCLVL